MILIKSMVKTFTIIWESGNSGGGHKGRSLRMGTVALISWPVTARSVGRRFSPRTIEYVRAQMDVCEIVDFNSLSETIQNLIRDAVKIRKKAYCPYSNFAVGAALQTEDDAKVYTGCNIENAAFSPSICAERAAICKAVCDGYLKVKKLAVVAHQRASFTAPCGVCRQTLLEFCPTDGDMDIYLSKPTMEKVLVIKLSKLHPLAFVSYTKDNVIAKV